MFFSHKLLTAMHSLCITCVMSEQAHGGNVPDWTIGDRLRKSLKEAKIGVQEMADYLGVERNTVGNYINDRTRIPGPALRLWVVRTGWPMEWFETGVDPSSPHSPDGGQSVSTCGYLADRVSLLVAA